MSQQGLVATTDGAVGTHPIVQRAIKTASGGTLVPWAPGQSGNPQGRSRRFFEVQNLAREASPEAIKGLIKLMDSPDERVAIIAMNAVLDRAYGKPKEQKTEDIQSVKPNLSALSPEQLAQFRSIMSTLAGNAAAQDVVVSPPDETPKP